MYDPSIEKTLAQTGRKVLAKDMRACRLALSNFEASTLPDLVQLYKNTVRGACIHEIDDDQLRGQTIEAIMCMATTINDLDYRMHRRSRASQTLSLSNDLLTYMIRET